MTGGLFISTAAENTNPLLPKQRAADWDPPPQAEMMGLYGLEG